MNGGSDEMKRVEKARFGETHWSRAARRVGVGRRSALAGLETKWRAKIPSPISAHHSFSRGSTSAYAELNTVCLMSSRTCKAASVRLVQPRFVHALWLSLLVPRC
jgi:hypothetical protein